MWKELALGFGLALAVSTDLFAAAPAAAPPATAAPVDTHLAAAVELLESQNAKANMRVMTDSIMTTAASAIRAEHPTVSDDNLKLFYAAFSQEMEASFDDLLKVQAKVYEAHFSESELRALTAFYKSDLGRKVISETPAITREEVPIGIKWGQTVAPAAMQRALDKLKKEGVKL